jgi:hypothetical protein
MSQTNAFYKAQNPDYVYLDLQQSNVYNNTTGPDVDVNFVETRDNPVIANTGEYNMSVTRFQIDSYNLPTIVVEPDITQSDVNKTVHKVAIMTFGGSTAIPVPDPNKNIASVVNVTWVPNPIYPAPSMSTLTGKNTVENPYYWCNSYHYFIDLVNTALQSASIANYNYLFTNCITGASTAIKGEFFDAAFKSFPTPPFLDWDTDTLKAKLYVNHCYNLPASSNWAVRPITWSGSVGTLDTALPLHFKVALSPSLYALFNSFPATETILTTTTGTKEKFYVLNINSRGYPIITPSPTIQKTLFSSYNFGPTLSGSTYTLSPTTSTTYTYSNQFLEISQELSTIDTWSPVNGIVFTTNTLPIVANQFNSNSVINSDRPSFVTGEQYALIITDLQSNEQGYKPNLLYNPTAEYRRIDMTGNRGLTNIDIRVFWRAKTGQLIPFKLSSGISASIKILFQKKILGEKQQLQLAQTIRELDLEG